jgi:glycosyltransferase domain-containing protein
MLSKKITILLPTKNRHDVLFRALRYYSEVGFQGCICIGDSSDAEHLECNKNHIQMFSSRLNIVHKEYPELDEPQCSQQLANMINTPYVAWVADDDFLVPSGLEKCMMFLEKHPEYSAAHGLCLRIVIKDNTTFGPIVDCKFIDQQAVEEAESASERLLNYAKHPTTVTYSVHRTQTLQLILRNNHLIHDRVFAGRFPEYISVIKGKIKELDCLSLIRGKLGYRYISSEEVSIYCWLTNEKWLSYFNIFQDAYLKELMQQDQIGLDKAQEVVKQFLSIFIYHRLRSDFRMNYPHDHNSLFRHKIIQTKKGLDEGLSLFKRLKYLIPGLQRFRRKLIDFGVISSARINRHEMLLPLLDPSSPYHRDFMPIYHAYTVIPENMK